MSLTIGPSQGLYASSLSRLAETPLTNAARTAPIAGGVQRMLDAAVREPGGGSGERTLVASENGVDVGQIHDAYDLKLYREADGTYKLEMEMTVEFNFKDGKADNGSSLEWTDAEKTQFMKDYVSTVEGTWDGRTITLDNGTKVTLDIKLETREQPGGFFGGIRDMMDSSEHWNIDVTRIEDGGFRQSSVTPGRNYGDFDSQDNKPADKGADHPQYGTAHEFGHMIGLPDEYPADHPNTGDSNSVMNRGNEVRDRHLDLLETWVDAKI